MSCANLTTWMKPWEPGRLRFSGLTVHTLVVEPVRMNSALFAIGFFCDVSLLSPARRPLWSTINFHRNPNSWHPLRPHLWFAATFLMFATKPALVFWGRRPCLHIISLAVSRQGGEPTKTMSSHPPFLIKGNTPFCSSHHHPPNCGASILFPGLLLYILHPSPSKFKSICKRHINI